MKTVKIELNVFDPFEHFAEMMIFLAKKPQALHRPHSPRESDETVSASETPIAASTMQRTRVQCQVSQLARMAKESVLIESVRTMIYRTMIYQKMTKCGAIVIVFTFFFLCK